MTLDARILVVEDDEAQRQELAGFLKDLGATVHEAPDGHKALELLTGTSLDVVITDLRLPGLTGREVLHQALELRPDLSVLVVTAYGTVEEAVAALKEGAVDFLRKPLDLDEVEHQVRRATEESHLKKENRELKERLGAIESIPGIVTAGGNMTRVLSTVARVADSAISVLVLGESGTGKELVARAIHAAGPRQERPVVTVNASALSSTLLESELFGHERGAFTGADRARTGRFEAAQGGTLFLDEVGDLPQDAQVKLLRVLQEKEIERVGSNEVIEVDVRVIAATHRDLLAELPLGGFREDLYYRLAVVTVEIPPLRQRRADIPLLVEHFLQKHKNVTGGEIKSFSREAMDTLMRYPFPGNVRELENTVQRCMVLARGEAIYQDDLPPAIRQQSTPEESPGLGPEATLPQRIADLERQAIAEALEAQGGNQTRAARLLGISERALRYKLQKLKADS